MVEIPFQCCSTKDDLEPLQLCLKLTGSWLISKLEENIFGQHLKRHFEYSLQGCQLSWIIWESQDFEPYLPVSRFMSVISRFWAISSGVQIYACNIPDNWRSLLFVVDSTSWEEYLKCLSLFVVPVKFALMGHLCKALCYRHILHIWRREVDNPALSKSDKFKQSYRGSECLPMNYQDTEIIFDLSIKGADVEQWRLFIVKLVTSHAKNSAHLYS